MYVSSLIKEVEKYNVTLVVEDRLLKARGDIKRLPDDLMRDLVRRRNEVARFISGRTESVTLDFCRIRGCRFLLDHVANPRCLHPLATENGRYPAGCWLGYLVSCPEQTGRLEWKH